MNKYFCLMLMFGSVTMTQAEQISDGEALFKSKICVACHTTDFKLVGPAFKDVAEKYKAQKDAAILLAGHIKNGTQGAWGAIPMPANPVTDEEAKLLADWVLSLKK